MKVLRVKNCYEDGGQPKKFKKKKFFFPEESVETLQVDFHSYVYIIWNFHLKNTYTAGQLGDSVG